MELGFNGIMLMSLMKLRDAVESDGLERIMGKRLLSNEERISRNFDKDDSAGYEQVLIEDTTENLYGLILTRPEVFATALSLKDLRAPENVKGYYQNMQKIFADLLRFEKNIKFAVENEMENSYLLFKSEDVRASFAEFMIFMKKIMPYFELAVKIDRISRRTNKAGEEFFEVVPELNGQIRQIFHEASGDIGDWKAPGVVFRNKHDVIMQHFDENSSFVDSKKAIFDEKQKQMAALQESKKSTSKPVELGAEELERRKVIQEANMMYDELVQNTMRDLEKQVPYSVRKMYEYFVNEKFAKFVKSFSMPLSSSTRLATAREACNQLNELNNYISRISENAVTTNVYMMKE